jgi:hypothetical protein
MAKMKEYLLDQYERGQIMKCDSCATDKEVKYYTAGGMPFYWCADCKEEEARG